jgi:hypothetical protein
MAEHLEVLGVMVAGGSGFVEGVGKLTPSIGA